MNTSYNDYSFIISKNTSKSYINAYHSVYIKAVKVDDNEISLCSVCGGGGFSLYLQDRFLFFGVDNDTKRIASLEGNVPLKEITYRNLEMPKKITNTILQVDTSEDLPVGFGDYAKFDKQIIIYDKTEHLLQYGKIDPLKETYKILENCYVQLNGGALCGIILDNIIF